MSSELTTPQAAPAPGVLDWFYGVLFRPREAFATWPIDRAQGAAGLSVLLVALIGGFTSAGTGGDAVVLGFFTWLGWLVLGWFTSTALLFVIGRVMRQQGEFLPLLSAIGLALLPMILVGPLHAVAAFAGIGTAIGVLGELAVFIWMLRLVVAAVKGVMGLSTGQAVLAIVIAEATLAAIPWLLFSLGIMSLVLAVS
jgi:hypothetical protein